MNNERRDHSRSSATRVSRSAAQSVLEAVAYAGRALLRGGESRAGGRAVARDQRCAEGSRFARGQGAWAFAMVGVLVAIQAVAAAGAAQIGGERSERRGAGSGAVASGVRHSDAGLDPAT